MAIMSSGVGTSTLAISELRSTVVDVTIDTEVAELVWNIPEWHEERDINVATPEIGGTSEPNSKITIFVNGVEKAIATIYCAQTLGRSITCFG